MSFKDWEPKDIAIIILAITVAIISLTSIVGAVFFKVEGGRVEELVAFLLGSMMTIIGEYILLNIKNKK